MKFKPLTALEIVATGYTHRLDFDVTDIPAGIANNTAYTWSTGFLPLLGALGLNLSGTDRMQKVQAHTSIPFANSADTGLNTTTLSVGDNSSTTRYINAVELNKNGSTTYDTYYTTGFEYTSLAQLQFTLGSMASKSLSSLNQGKFYVLFEIHQPGAPKQQQAPPFGTGY
jgi:hypothetical protein